MPQTTMMYSPVLARAAFVQPPPATKLNWMAWTGIALGVGALGVIVWSVARR